MRGAAQAALGVRLAADGTVAGEPARVGAAACTTASSAAWVERGAGGAWAVNGLSGSRASASTLFTVSEDRDPVLLCAERTVFALGDGDDDVTLQWAGSAGAPASARVIGPRDFRGDDERLHEGYAAGDTVGVVRIGTGGSVAVREVSDGHASSWRRLTHRLAESDDVDALDADPTVGVLAFSRDANPDGEGKGAGVVDALVWGRAPGGAEGSWKLADADPQAVRGPFASGAVSGGVAVAWVERGVEERKASESPVRLAYRLVALAGPGPLGRVDGPFVDILDAGCDGARCYAVGFRPSSDDGGAPGATLDVIAYP
jgi:hypothetical protein